MSGWGTSTINVGDKLTFGMPVFGWPKGTLFWVAPGRKIVPYPAPKAKP